MSDDQDRGQDAGQDPGQEKISIETPEQVPLEFPLAGIGSRFLAIAVDTLYQVVAGLVVFLVVVFSGQLSSSSLGSNWIMALAFIGIFLIHFGYFAIFEAVWHGQTPGKRRYELRVIKDDGRPITAYDAVGRNLMRIIDSIPGSYGIGVLSVFFSSQGKRLGDYLAGTIVVHDKALNMGSSLSFRQSQVHVESTGHKLTPEQFAVLDAYTVRKYDLEPPLRAKFANQILDRLSATMSFSAEERRDPDAMIERLVNEHRNR